MFEYSILESLHYILKFTCYYQRLFFRNTKNCGLRTSNKVDINVKGHILYRILDIFCMCPYVLDPKIEQVGFISYFLLFLPVLAFFFI